MSILYKIYKTLAMVSLAIVLILAAGCSKKPVNQNIEGHWKLLKFTILETGEVVTCDRLFYGITHKVTKVMEKQGPHGVRTYSALTEYRENEKFLVLKMFRYKISKEPKVQDAKVEELLPYGINNPAETVFEVMDSSHKRLVLESDYARLELSRF